MQFQILNETRYYLPIQNSTDQDILLPYYRWEHRATLGYNTREFMVFIDNLNNKLYIEEIIGGHLEKVQDNELWMDLYYFAQEKGYANLMPPLLKPERFI